MGVIRVLLAIAVVLAHAGAIFGFKHIDGLIAVQSFFIISGFYMSMIINEKYNFRNSYKLFISNRLLRLFPTYILIIVITFLVILLFHVSGQKQGLITNFSHLNILSKIYVFFINLFIVGQDSTLFLGFDTSGSLHYVSDFNSSNPPVYSFLLCPPAWSLSLELMFYFIAPYLVKRKISLIFFIMILSFLLRIFIYKQGYSYDPWIYRFFPTELFFFLSGTISYRLYNYLRNIEHTHIKKIGLFLLCFVILSILFFNFIPVKYYLKQYLFYFTFTFSIPVIFIYTKNNRIDRFIGELSYPVYLSHIFIMYYWLPVFNDIFGLSSLNSILAVIFSILFSVLLIKYIIKPIDDYREKRVNGFNKNKQIPVTNN